MTVEVYVPEDYLYDGDDTTVVFPYGWKIWDASEIEVIPIDADGVELPALTLTTHYTVSGVGNEAGGNVTLVGYYAANPPATGTWLAIRKKQPFTQAIDFVEHDDFSPEDMMELGDRLLTLCQQLKEKVDRAALVSIVSGLANLILPIEALKYLKGNAAGDGLEAVAGEPPTNVWRYGSGVPSDALGTDGDYYLNIVTGDIYYKIAGAWGSAIANIKGLTGNAAPAVKLQYSINGSTNWHDTYASGDKYVKFSVDNGVTYTAAMKFIGDNGAGSGDMAKATYDPDANGVIAAAQLDTGILYKSLYDVYSILMATTDNTPVPLTVGEQTIVGRITSGAIAALTVAQLQTLALSVALAENISILFSAALSADGKYTSLNATAGTLGETVAFGEAVYLKASDSKWWKAKADVTATSGAVTVGFCCVGGNANAATIIMFKGVIRADALFDTFTVSAPVFISAATTGKVVSTAPTGTTGFVVRVMGRALDGNTIRVDISGDYLELA